MALIPNHYFKAIVAIGKLANPQTGQVAWMGTGFIYGNLIFPPTIADQYSIFLITNKHVIINHDEVILRFDNSNGSNSQFLTPLKQNGTLIWIPHPDPEVDIAILPLNGQLLSQHLGTLSAFRSDKDVLLLSNQTAQHLCEGDGVFVMGFPLGLVHSTQNLAIVRGGGIARIKDCIGGHSKQFLIDAQIFPGNSGGPVVLKPEISSIQGTTPISNSYLIGIVNAYIPYRDVAISTQTGREKVSFEENSGLAVVFPVDKIQEVVNLVIQSSNPPQQSNPVPAPTTAENSPD